MSKRLKRPPTPTLRQIREDVAAKVSPILDDGEKLDHLFVAVVEAAGDASILYNTARYHAVMPIENMEQFVRRSLNLTAWSTLWEGLLTDLRWPQGDSISLAYEEGRSGMEVLRAFTKSMKGIVPEDRVDSWADKEATDPVIAMHVNCWIASVRHDHDRLPSPDKWPRGKQAAELERAHRRFVNEWQEVSAPVVAPIADPVDDYKTPSYLDDVHGFEPLATPPSSQEERASQEADLSRSDEIRLLRIARDRIIRAYVTMRDDA